MKIQSQQKSEQIKLTKAFIYFNNPLPKPLDQKQFEEHLVKFENANFSHQLKIRITPYLVEKYYSIINEEIKLEEYLHLKLLSIIGQHIKSMRSIIEGCTEQTLVVVVWAGVSYLKKIAPKKQNRTIISRTLESIKKSLQVLATIKKFSMKSIYPQVSSILLRYITQIFDFTVYKDSLELLGNLLLGCMKGRKQSDQLLLIFGQQGLSINLDSLSAEQRFDYECVNRLQSHFRAIITKFGNYGQNFKVSMMNFLKSIEQIGINFMRLIVPYCVLLVLAGGTLQLKGIKASKTKFVRSAITDEFINLISRVESEGSKTNLLYRLVKIAPYLELTEQKENKIISLFLNRIYIFQNNNQLVTPHNSISHSTYLAPLEGKHSFSTYEVPLSSLSESLDFQINRFLVTKMPYSEMDLQNVRLLKEIIQNLDTPVLQNILENLVMKISMDENQYSINMSLTKFSQFMTKIILIYWIMLAKNYQPSLGTAEALFQSLVSSQTIRILTPSFKEQELLISLVLQICYQCYTKKLIVLPPLKKLKKKIALLQILINNAYEESFIIKLSAYQALLKEAAPETVSVMLVNLQSTLINRNLHNLKFIKALVNICKLSSNESEDLANKIILNRASGSQEVIRAIFNNLSTKTLRKCLLSAAPTKWIYMMLGNCHHLYNRQIKQAKSALDEKIENFYMNDGQNVVISNALGVIILELGQKWQICFDVECPIKEVALDLVIELLDLNSEMVFFKYRFSTIFVKLVILLQKAVGEKNKNYERITHKIFNIVDKLPEQNLKLFLSPPKNLQVNLIDTHPETTAAHFHKLAQIIATQHKTYQVQYFSNSNPGAEHLYNLTQKLLEKLEPIISNNP